MRNRLIPAALALTALALVAAGCGSGSSSGGGGAYGGGSKTTNTTAAASGGTTVSATKNNLGTTLVGPNGRTLYLFEKDSGGKSACTSGGCASIWPALTVKSKPTAGSGVDASKLGTTAGANGAKIVTYNGHPLYYYTSDVSPGQTTGQGINSFGAQWFVVGTNGDKIAVGGSSGSSGGGGAY
jgi:predicted lipoprotein with Yx(FWY)xxD motif